MADHYKTLGVSATASGDEIKNAYKALAKKWHPDRNQSNKERTEEKFKEISAAYKTLSGEKSRKEYDASQRQQTLGKSRRATFDSGDHARGKNDYKYSGTQKSSPRVQAEVIDLTDAFLIFRDVFKDDPAHGGPFFTTNMAEVDKVFDAFFSAPPPNPDKFLKGRGSGYHEKSIGN